MANNDTNYALHARMTYERLLADRHRSFQGHSEYGKWLIASMLAVHGGGIYTLMSLRQIFPPERGHDLIFAAMFNVAGIVLIMLAGFLAWLNFQIAEMQIGRWINPAMLYDTEQWPKEDGQSDRWVNFTLYAAAATGIGSWLCFIGAAAMVFKGLW